MATRKKHTPEQVATADRMLGERKDIADVCRELQVSEQTLILNDPLLPLLARSGSAPGHVSP